MRLSPDPGLGQLEQAVRSRSVSTWQGLDFQLTLSPVRASQSLYLFVT